MKFIKYITYIILIIVIGLPLKAQHWEIVPSLKHYRQLDTINMDKNYSPRIDIVDVRGDTLISFWSYLQIYHDKQWKFIHQDTLLKNNIKDTSILSKIIGRIIEPIKFNMEGENIIIESMYTLRSIDYLRKVFSLYQRKNDKYECTTIDKIYNSDSAKYDTLSLLLNITIDDNNTPYCLLVLRKDYWYKLFHNRIRLCKIEADTFKTFHVFYDINLSGLAVGEKPYVILMQFDKIGNLLVVINDTLLYFNKDKLVKTIDLKKIKDNNGNNHYIVVKQMLFDKDNNLVLVDKNGLVAFNNNDNWTIDTIPTKSPRNMVFDLDDNIWTADVDFLFKRDKNGAWSKVFIEPYFPIGSKIFCDNQNRIWIYSNTIFGGSYSPTLNQRNAVAGIYYIND